jgi:hypothetical protein
MTRTITSAFLFLLVTACGAVESGGPPEVVDHAGPDAGTSSEPVPGVAPTVVSIDPPTGSVVEEEVAITIRFSEPMDQAAVEAAIEFPGMAPSFDWNPDGTEVTASRQVAYPQGSDPDQVAPRTFEVALGSGARDEDGEPLEGGALALSYTLRYRRITQAFPFSQTLSGNCFLPCSGTWSWVVAGENMSDTTVTNRGFLTIPFDLPAGIVVEKAVLDTEIELVTGNPFGELGDLLVDDVGFSAINDLSLYGRGTLLGALFTGDQGAGAGATASFDFTEAFAEDYEHRAERSYRTQLRLRFLHDNPEDPAYDSYHSDGNQDVVRLLRDATSLSVTYLIE